MSYRDMRNFTEMMRALHFPRHISIENFRSSNFRLVAEILLWLVRRFEPLADLPTVLDSEQDRVIFIRSAVQLMYLKTNLRLNPKKLYQADGYAVKELLKPATMLYQAVKQQNAVLAASTGKDEPGKKGSKNREPEDDEDQDIFAKLDRSKLLEVKEARLLSSEITSKAANLSSQLALEVELREVRQSALGHTLELRDMEHGLKSAMKALDVEMKRVTEQNGRIAADEANLDAKIEKKKAELERTQKRLSTLEAVRPAYMDEFEELEQDLARMYQDYVRKYTTLAYLESEYEAHCRMDEDAEVEPSAPRAVTEGGGSNELVSSGEDEENLVVPRKQISTKTRTATTNKARQFGSVMNDDEDDDEEESDAMISEDDSEEDGNEDEESAEGELSSDSEVDLRGHMSRGGGGQQRPMGHGGRPQQPPMSDSPSEKLVRPSTGRGMRRPAAAGAGGHEQSAQSRPNNTKQKVSKKPPKNQVVESDDDF